MTVKQLFDTQKKRLTTFLDSQSEAAQTLLIIFENIKGWSQTDILVRGDDEASEFLTCEVDKAVNRVLKGEPVQYIFGKAHFYGLVLNVSPATLIPRPETAELVDMIVDRYKKTPDLSVLDIATGSGCIAVALARNLPFARVDAIDISTDALEVARSNNRLLKTEVNFMEGDILKLTAPSSPVYDIIVSNPPYITEKEKVAMEANVLEWEPSIALFVPDEQPLLFYTKIAGLGLEMLVSGGRLYFEINRDYGAATVGMLERLGYHHVELRKDLSGNDRMIKAIR